MNQTLALFIQHSTELVIPLSIFLITVIVGYIVRKFLFTRLSSWTGKSSTKIDDIIIEATKGPFLIWCLMLGIYFALEFSKLPQEWVHVTGKIMLVLGMFSVTFVLASISTRLVKIYSGKLEAALPVTSLTQNIARIIIFGIGILIILNSLGISITPILATLGVGGLAVALALQDTLSNLFSGFHITISRQIRIGDYIKLESGEEGYVTDINWRTTKVRMLPNNIVLVPNAKLIQSIVTNYYLPDQEMAVLVNLGVHYNSNLKKVEKITCEVAREVMKEVPGGVPEFDPFIRYHTFADFSINFTVILRAKEFVDQYLVKHEFIKRLHERYDKEGIIIPYPIRAVNYKQEKAG
ncbi:MAG: mechanosensitive ion channel family protein [Candidatus Omnitrophica bacterium]|nr:mechanosensitive ion channel family protein [Candidatus Omnitrophota bacterium]MDD5237353.1 mechanosensitive ion channel family protein [Candidatus Omnitrophota bacterium]